MKIQQESLEFKPITLKLEKKSEAEAFFSLIYKLDSFYSNEGETFHHNDFTKEQRALIIKLVNSGSEIFF